MDDDSAVECRLVIGCDCWCDTLSMSYHTTSWLDIVNDARDDMMCDESNDDGWIWYGWW